MEGPDVTFEPDNKSRRKSMVVVSILAFIIIVAAIGLYAKSSNGQNTVTTDPSHTTGGTTPSTNTSYKNGSYSGSGSYPTPGGQESITVELTLSNNIVTDTNVTTSENSPQAASYQQQFKDNYRPFVVGKNINDITLSRISGSSLTPQGFNEAVDAIKSQAKA